MWHCPHCGAPQAETARCWVCRQSSTTCSTCRHFRRSLAADVGWCSLDPKRLPLTGLELRGCWEERPRITADPPPGEPVHRLRERAHTPVQGDQTNGPTPPPRTFVPVELLATMVPVESPAESTAEPPPIPLIAADLDESWVDRTSLFGDREG